MGGRWTEQTRHTSRVCLRCSGFCPARALVLLGTSARVGTLPNIFARLSPHYSGLGSNVSPQSSLPRSPTSKLPPPCASCHATHFICFGALVSTCDQSLAMLVLVFAAGLPNDTILSFCALAPDRAQNSCLTLSRCSMKVCWLTTKRECASHMSSAALDPSMHI